MGGGLIAPPRTPSCMGSMRSPPPTPLLNSWLRPCVSSCGSRLLWGLCGSLLAFPCLRVGAPLACGVYGASSLQSLQSRLPFVVLLFMSLFVLHLLLRWDGLVTGLWPLLLLLCVGLLWGLCCLGVLSHPLLLLFLAWVSSFGVCSDLGW